MGTQYRHRWYIGLVAAAISGGCFTDSRDLHAARAARTRAPSGFSSESWGLCNLVSPSNHEPGVWGADLGFSAHAANDRRLTFLFGDTWASPIAGCQYSPAPDNDMQATLPLARPAHLTPGPPLDAGSVNDCKLVEYAHESEDDPTSWRRARLFPGTRHDEPPLDMSGLRTPLATFSDGERMLALFFRHDPVLCKTNADCPNAMQCTGDANYDHVPLGACSHVVDLQPDPPTEFCSDDNDCIIGSRCEFTAPGVCVANTPFVADTARGPRIPSWYRDDPKRGLANDLYVAAAIWPDRPADYATIARFATQRFLNVTTRTVTFFDPQHPEQNDYRPGYHTLLLWGRATFVGSGGEQALPFFAYVPLDELRGAPEHARWRPRFFAGYDAAGDPMWSEFESDAKPVYGTTARVSQQQPEALEWEEPEFDLVAQMTVSWVAPLSRWVMFYGGDLPAFMVADAKTGKTHDPRYLQWAPGAIHMRVAPHPWGAAHVPPAAVGGGQEPAGWSSAEPVLSREQAAPYLACGAAGREELPGCEEEHATFRPTELAGSLARAALHGTSWGRWFDTLGICLLGELERAFQSALSGDPIGRLYAPNIIEEWTADVTDPAARARGEASAEVYWNVSTWNPYQVTLFKTRLQSMRDTDDNASKTALRR